MENVTIGQVIIFLSIASSIGGVLLFLSKIYKEILETKIIINTNDTLTRVSLKATKVMLDYFIADKIGNGEFKKAREEIDDALLDKKVG